MKITQLLKKIQSLRMRMPQLSLTNGVSTDENVTTFENKVFSTDENATTLKKMEFFSDENF